MNCRIFLIILIGYLPLTVFGQGEQAGWKEAGQLPVGHVRSLFETNSGILYAASEESFFRSSNANGDSWTRIDLPKAFTINFIYEYDTKILVGTDRHGIYEFYPNEQDVNRRWINITDKVFEADKLEGENLSVNAIVASGDILLANVYHEGNPSHGGSHSRIYASADRGRTWEQKIEFDTHNFVFSFTIDNTNSRIIASTLNGILTANVLDPALIWTTASTLVAKKIISVGSTEFIGLPANTSEGVLYRSTDNGNTWSQIAVNDTRVKSAITDISWGFDSGLNKFYLYASTYDGIFKITKENLINSTAWETEYPSNTYISNIRTRSSNKFATAETGVLRRLSGNTSWTQAENGLKINYVYATHANNMYVLAVTDNGLYRSAVDLITNKFNWEPVARNILVLGAQNRFLETRRAAIASNQTGATEEIFVGTNNGIIRSRDGGVSWAKINSLPVIQNPLDRNAFIYYQENIQSMMFAGNHLYAVAYETPFILKNREGAWQEITKGLPFVVGRTGQIFYNGIIRGMQEVAGEVYLYWEDYTSSAGRGGHDIWTFPDLKGSGIYKLDMASETWVAVKSLEQEGKVRGFVAFGDQLIFSAQNKDRTYTFHSFNVKDQHLQKTNNPLSDSDGFIKEIYKSNGNLFMTNTENKTIFVSPDGGRIWKKIADAPSSVSALTVSNNFVYAGITGNGMWHRNFYEFFPIIIEDEKVLNSVEADANNLVTESSSDTVSIVLNQFIPGTTVALFTRSLTRDNWQQHVVTSNTEKFSIKLPHTQFDEVGLAYYWAVTPPQAYQNPANPVVKTQVVKTAVQYTKGLPMPERLKMNKNPKKTPYQMIAFPLVSDNNSVQVMLGDELNIKKNDDGLWRLVSYNTTDDKWKFYSSDDPLAVGKGYWLAATEGLNKKNKDPLQITTSPGKTVANELKTDTEGNYYYEVPLIPNDWVQIGNPLLINIDWNDVINYPLNSNLRLGQLFTYANNVRGQDGRLAKFSGGYIKNETPETVLRIPVMRSTKYNEARKSAEQEILENATLAISFSIESQEMICKLAGLGIHAEAQAGLDPFDLVVPPSPGGFPTMRFTTGAVEKQIITRSFVPPQAEGQEWEFTVTEMDKEEKVTLNWQELKMEAGKALWLHDLDAERKVDMLAANKYQFTGTRRFRVYHGSEQYLNTHLMPEKSLLAVYPNPLSESTTISFTLPENSENSQVKLSLMDATGRQIQVIHELTYDAGFHELAWNTTSATQQLPPGLYLIELQINSHGNIKTHYQKVIKR